MPSEKELIEARARFDEGLLGMFTASGKAAPVMVVPVLEGETFWQLAVRFFGDGQRWREIYFMNIDVMLREDLEASQTPDTVYPGTEFKLFVM